MSFLSLIIRNLLRHRARSLLTIVGISIGIATIVTLGLITEGLKGTVEEAIKAGKADFSIAQAGVVDLILSTIKQEELKEVQKMEGIKNAVGVLIASVPVSFNPYFIAIGINQEDIKLGGININEGRIFQKNSQNEIILGKVAAKNFRKKIGEEIQVGPIRYKIVGIFERQRSCEGVSTFDFLFFSMSRAMFFFRAENLQTQRYKDKKPVLN